MAFDHNVREIAGGLGFLEGPVACDDGTLLVVDLASGWIVKVDPSSGRADPHVFTGGSPNGMAFGPGGALYVCNNGGMAFAKSAEGDNIPAPEGTPPLHPRQPGIQIVTPDGAVRDLYTECDGNPLSSPNDLVFDQHGGFYFTDLGRHEGRLCNLGGLYYARADGSRIVELIHDPMPMTPLTQPNGVGLSPAGDRVYVAETVTGRVWAWTIESPGVLGPMPNSLAANGAGLLFGHADYMLFDSMAVDRHGYVCVATLLKGGITVLDPDGKLDEFIPLPDPFVTNICFGGPEMRTAYVTGAGSGKIWALDWPREGLRLPHAC